jgi:hypothetical protein
LKHLKAAFRQCGTCPRLARLEGAQRAMSRMSSDGVTRSSVTKLMKKTAQVIVKNTLITVRSLAIVRTVEK